MFLSVCLFLSRLSLYPYRAWASSLAPLSLRDCDACCAFSLPLVLSLCCCIVVHARTFSYVCSMYSYIPICMHKAASFKARRLPCVLTQDVVARQSETHDPSTTTQQQPEQLFFEVKCAISPNRDTSPTLSASEHVSRLRASVVYTYRRRCYRTRAWERVNNTPCHVYTSRSALFLSLAACIMLCYLYIQQSTSARPNVFSRLC